jgi:hypothetical protein
MLQSRELMEEFRGLLNLELPAHKLVTFIFFGLQSLDQTLALDEPLKQRVALRYRLSAMGLDSTAAYIATGCGLPAPEGNSVGMIALIQPPRASRGDQRHCDNCLFEAFLIRRPHRPRSWRASSASASRPMP